MKKKITTELKQYQKLGRMADFTTANQHRFEAGTPVSETGPHVVSTVKKLNALTASQGSLENRLREVLRAKADARANLSTEMEFLYHTARSIAAETTGFDDKFQMPLKSDPKLLNAARSAVEDAAALTDFFLKHAIPSDLLDPLTVAIRKFEQASEDYANGKTACTIGGQELRRSLDDAVAAAKAFDAIMRNTFRSDAITLAAWKDVCRVRRTPRITAETAVGTEESQPQPPVQPDPTLQPQPTT